MERRWSCTLSALFADQRLSRTARSLPMCLLDVDYHTALWPDNAAAISDIGLLQSPNVACRYSCMDLYHGVSRWLLDQRSSQAADSSTHTGRPSAPARWAGPVSTAINKYHLFDIMLMINFLIAVARLKCPLWACSGTAGVGDTPISPA